MVNYKPCFECFIMLARIASIAVGRGPEIQLILTPLSFECLLMFASFRFRLLNAKSSGVYTPVIDPDHTVGLPFSRTPDQS